MEGAFIKGVESAVNFNGTGVGGCGLDPLKALCPVARVRCGCDRQRGVAGVRCRPVEEIFIMDVGGAANFNEVRVGGCGLDQAKALCLVARAGGGCDRQETEAGVRCRPVEVNFVMGFESAANFGEVRVGRCGLDHSEAVCPVARGGSGCDRQAAGRWPVCDAVRWRWTPSWTLRVRRTEGGHPLLNAAVRGGGSSSWAVRVRRPSCRLRVRGASWRSRMMAFPVAPKV